MAGGSLWKVAAGRLLWANYGLLVVSIQPCLSQSRGSLPTWTGPSPPILRPQTPSPPPGVLPQPQPQVGDTPRRGGPRDPHRTGPTAVAGPGQGAGTALHFAPGDRGPCGCPGKRKVQAATPLCPLPCPAGRAQERPPPPSHPPGSHAPLQRLQQLPALVFVQPGLGGRAGEAGAGMRAGPAARPAARVT